MNQDELQAVELEIRSILADSRLEWVLDEVDEAITAGVPEEKFLRRSQRSRGSVDWDAEYEVIDETLSSVKGRDSSRGRGSLVIATRPMTNEERVVLLLEALRRVLVELPEIEVESLKVLRIVPEDDDGSRTMIEGIAFELEGVSRHRRRTRFALGDGQSQERRQRLSTLFAEADHEVRR